MSVINFPQRHNFSGRTDIKSGHDLKTDLLAISNYLDTTASKTGISLWMKSMAKEIRRAAREC